MDTCCRRVIHAKREGRGAYIASSSLGEGGIAARLGDGGWAATATLGDAGHDTKYAMPSSLERARSR